MDIDLGMSLDLGTNSTSPVRLNSMRPLDT